MSSSLEAVQDSVKKVSKKRKHTEDSKESKKKRKQLDESIENNEAERPPSKAEKDQKKKKKRSQETEDVQKDSFTVANGADLPVSPIRTEKKKKKRQKENAEDKAETEQPEAQAGDTRLLDTPAIEQGDMVIDTEFKATTQDSTLSNTADDQLQSQAASSFHTVRMSLYLPTPSIGLDKPLAAVLTLHITPLLLTYFPPAGGVILSIHDPVLSATPQDSLNLPLLPPSSSNTVTHSSSTYPKVGDEFGACWAWLTVTFVVYSPQPGDELQGWTNAMSEGFIGLVCYNYFQTSIAKNRIPKAWTWDGPSRGPRQRKTHRKGKLNDGDGPSQDSHFDSQDTIVAREDDAIDGTAGTFLDENGIKIPETLRFHVVDLEMIPAQERGQLALQVEGTLLDEKEEATIREEERQKFETRMGKLRARSRTPGTPMMSGGLPSHSRAGSALPTP